MSRLRSATFFPEDVDALLDTALIKPELPELKYFIKPEFSISGFYDDKIVYAGGVFPLWPGVGSAWFLIDREFSKHVKREVWSFVRHIKEFLNALSLHRIQADISCTQPAALRLVKLLGFKFEGNMIAYGADQTDYARWALTRRSE